MDHRPPLAPFHRALGVAATVTPPDGRAVATTVIALEERPLQFPSAGGALAGVEMRKPFSLRRDQVPSVPTGTTIAIAAGPDAGVWSVDAVELETAEEVRALTVRLA